MNNAVSANNGVENETVWLTQAQMAELFDVQRQAITKHIKNIFESHELEEKSTSSILELVQKEGSRNVLRKVALYNLDMIISVVFLIKQTLFQSCSGKRKATKW